MGKLKLDKTVKEIRGDVQAIGVSRPEADFLKRRKNTIVIFGSI